MSLSPPRRIFLRQKQRAKPASHWLALATSFLMLLALAGLGVAQAAR